MSETHWLKQWDVVAWGHPVSSRERVGDAEEGCSHGRSRGGLWSSPAVATNCGHVHLSAYVPPRAVVSTDPKEGLVTGP